MAIRSRRICNLGCRNGCIWCTHRSLLRLGPFGQSPCLGVSDMYALQTDSWGLESRGIELKKVHVHACGSHALHEHSVTEIGCIWQWQRSHTHKPQHSWPSAVSWAPEAVTERLRAACVALLPFLLSNQYLSFVFTFQPFLQFWVDSICHQKNAILNPPIKPRRHLLQ
jgi:hypothetical protein